MGNADYYLLELDPIAMRVNVQGYQKIRISRLRLGTILRLKRR